MRLAVLLASMFWASLSAADLYRWVDPETGSVKFSSYPPPWYGDPAQERRAPKVVVIPSWNPSVKPEPSPQEAQQGDKRPAGPGGKPAAPASAPRSP
jgi:hypothetical protein